MKKLVTALFYAVGLLVPTVANSQGLQVNPPSASTKKVVYVDHATYPSNYFFNDPNIISIDMNDAGDRVVKLQQTPSGSSVIITDIQSGKNSEIKTTHASKAVQVFFLNEQQLALKVQDENIFFEVIEIPSSQSIQRINANNFIGATSSNAYFSNESGSNASIESYDLSSRKTSNLTVVSGEVFGWYFSKSKGIVGVAVHSNMLSKIYSFANNKLGKSLFEFSSNYYFETKGCSTNGEVLFGITNFQSLTSYACSITSSGIKQLNIKTGESCTDVFVINNEVALNTQSVNAAEYQESQNPLVQKALAFSTESFKGSSMNILDYSMKNNALLICVQGEMYKPKYFIWTNNQAKPVSTDNYEAKNLQFTSSEIVQVQTGEATPQTGRMYLPSKEAKSSFPLVIYFSNNIFLPYPNKFNPVVQQLCQSGYAVFVWNTRFSFRPKIGFSYSDLVATFPEDLGLVLSYLKKEYSLQPDGTFLLGEGLGSYLALNASANSNEPANGVVINRMVFPGKEYTQDLIAARMFGEDAQSKWTTLDRIVLSEKTNYLCYQASKSNTETRFYNSVVQSKIKWTERAISQNKGEATSVDMDGMINWLQHLSQIETKVIETNPKVEVKKK